MADFLGRIWTAIITFISGVLYGAMKEKSRALEKEKEAAQDGREIHDRVVFDDAYRKRVRDRFR